MLCSGPAARRATFALLLLAIAAPTFAAGVDTTRVLHDPVRYGIVVSATKTTQSPLEVPNGVAIVSGAELRGTGARTLGEALVDVVGVETGGGSDNGGRLPNIGMWGLKEFDALLITVDGVPVGGPFNPSLAQIAVDDVDHVEIVKGPQGTLYGVSAFAGMVQVFTNRDPLAQPHSVTLGGGSFQDFHGRLAMQQELANAWRLDLALSGQTGDGWQERTHGEVERGRVSLAGMAGRASLGFDVIGLADRQDWGSPIPVDAGEVLPGFERTRNYAVKGAVQEHDVIAINQRLSLPVREGMRLDNTLSLTRDKQNSVRSFFAEFLTDTVGSAGVALRPIESVLFDDARLVSRFQLQGDHELVTGAAVTWGRTKASGIGFDFDQLMADPTTIPFFEDVPVGDHRAFEDRRTFLGVYAHDAWTPVRWATLAGGGRWDRTDEALHAFGEEVGFAAAISDDKRNDSAWSGDLSLLVRLLPAAGAGPLGVLNAYGNWKSSFKPAAPNLTEAEDARILDPERTHSLEGGFKGAAYDGQLAFDAAMFQMDFHNLVVSNLDASSNPVLLNAGHERFKGIEVSASVAPKALPGLTLSGGWANHDPRFVEFSFLTPDGQLRIVDGKIIELVPRQLWNARASYAPAKWLGGWIAARHQGQRPLTRRNTFWTEPFDELDAGLTFAAYGARLAVTGRNLGDERHFVSESDVGDSQFYYAPPKRFTAEVTYPF